jgi:hypothetical protein
VVGRGGGGGGVVGAGGVVGRGGGGGGWHVVMCRWSEQLRTTPQSLRPLSQACFSWVPPKAFSNPPRHYDNMVKHTNIIEFTCARISHIAEAQIAHMKHTTPMHASCTIVEACGAHHKHLSQTHAIHI